MSELEERLNSILGDPRQMETIAAMAKSLMAGTETGQKTPAPPPKEDRPPLELPSMAAMLGGGQRDRKRALLEAMKPFLSRERRDKLDRAMKLAKMIGMAELAFGMLGGDDAQI